MDPSPLDAHGRPAPLRTDGSNAFAHHSMAVRVPGIIEQMIERNGDYPASIKDALKRLHDEIAGNARMRVFGAPAPDHDMWARRLQAFEGESWLDTEWFFAEMFSYRWMVHVTRFWATGRDLFRPFKEEEMASDALWSFLDETLTHTASLEERVEVFLAGALWGNRIDLSLANVASRGTGALEDDLLANDLPAAVDHLLARRGGDVHLIMDNAGTEEALDLALSDLLLTEGIAAHVTLHVKMQPVLVSDAIVADIWRLISLMRGRGEEPQRLALRLEQWVEAGRLRVAPDFFWTTDGRLWEMPRRVVRAMEEVALVIAKGDVNYRRAANDAVWPPGVSLRDAVQEFPAPLLALRTLKSDGVLGLDAETHQRLDGDEPDWRTSGRYGVAQLAQFG